MNYKAIPVTHLISRQQFGRSVEIFEVQCSFPIHDIQPSEDFRHVIEESSAEIQEAFKEVMTRDS